MKALRLFQIPIGVAALAIGSYDIATGSAVVGVVVLVIGVGAAALAISRLRRT